MQDVHRRFGGSIPRFSLSTAASWSARSAFAHSSHDSVAECDQCQPTIWPHLAKTTDLQNWHSARALGFGSTIKPEYKSRAFSIIILV